MGSPHVPGEFTVTARSQASLSAVGETSSDARGPINDCRPFMTVQWWAWIAVIGFILAMLAVDLLFCHREAHEVSIREAATWSGIWIGLALCFGAIVWATLGGQAAGEYISGYLIEKSLSVDNLFVFALLLNYFAVPIAF